MALRGSRPHGAPGSALECSSPQCLSRAGGRQRAAPGAAQRAAPPQATQRHPRAPQGAATRGLADWRHLSSRGQPCQWHVAGARDSGGQSAGSCVRPKEGRRNKRPCLGAPPGSAWAGAAIVVLVLKRENGPPRAGVARRPSSCAILTPPAWWAKACGRVDKQRRGAWGRGCDARAEPVGRRRVAVGYQEGDQEGVGQGRARAPSPAGKRAAAAGKRQVRKVVGGGAEAASGAGRRRTVQRAARPARPGRAGAAGGGAGGSARRVPPRSRRRGTPSLVTPWRRSPPGRRPCAGSRAPWGRWS